MKTALVTGSCGLIGSACAKLLVDHGWMVCGIDNDQRGRFFGTDASTYHMKDRFGWGFQHIFTDIRNRELIEVNVRMLRPDLIIHTAAQPSHDRAAAIPYDDFDTNAVGTLNLLQAAREYCPESPFIFTSTNKVYGDWPNRLGELIESEKRYDNKTFPEGFDEFVPVDHCLHSLFGASKLAGDVLCQEYGRYFGMPVGIFRGGCLTGPHHAAVELHGYLAYIAQCAVKGKQYTIYGYKGKQVRDQIHCDDVARLFLEFYEHPKCGEVYNLGGGRPNSRSILETIDDLAALGHQLKYEYRDEPRRGDHICYYTDLTKVRQDFPGWQIQHTYPEILEGIVRAKEAAVSAVL